MRLSSSRSAATTPSPRPSGSTNPAALVTSTNRPPSLRKTWSGSEAKSRGLQYWIVPDLASAQTLLALDVEDQVMADVQVEVAVAVEVGPGRRCRPVAIAAQAGLRGHVLERSVAPVAEQGVRPPPRDEQVGMAVVVVVADGDAVAVASRESVQPGTLGDILERPVAAVAEQAVAAWRMLGGRERPALDGIDVEPAVAVVVEQAHAPAHRLREPL